MSLPLLYCLLTFILLTISNTCGDVVSMVLGRPLTPQEKLQILRCPMMTIIGMWGGHLLGHLFYRWRYRKER